MGIGAIAHTEQVTVPPTKFILDMDSSVSETYGRQEGSA